MFLRNRGHSSTKINPASLYKIDSPEGAEKDDDVGPIFQNEIVPTEDELRKFQDDLRETSAGIMSLRERLEFMLATSRLGMILDAWNTLLTITACALYVVETYWWSEENNEAVRDMSIFITIDMSISTFFMLDYILHLVVAHRRLTFCLSAQGLVEFLTSLTGFACFYLLKKGEYSPHILLIKDGSSSDAITTMLLVCLFRVMRIFRLVRISRLLAFVESEILRQVYAMTLSVVYLIFFASGLIHVVENTVYLWPDNGAKYQSMSFFEGIYLIVTTITTVGYGDLAPKTMLGRAVIMGMMCAALILVPRQTNKLVALLGMTSVYARQSYNRKSQSSHIVVSGDVHGRAILDFFKEFFHPDHGNTSQGAVILGEGLPSLEVRSLLSDPRFAYMITYLDGNVMLDRDLSRAALDQAEGIFLLTNKFSKTPQQDDASCILRALSVQRFLQKQLVSSNEIANASSKDNGAVLPTGILKQKAKKPTLCIQLLQSESRRLFESSRKQVGYNDLCQNQLVCIDEIKNNILAKSCLVPGLTTMINNLVASSEEASLSGNEAPWLIEYAEGVGYEMYRIQLSEYLQGLPFSNMAEAVYLETGVLVFALELAHVTAGSYVALNPGRFVIPRAVPQLAIFAIVLAGDLDEALVISQADKITEGIRDKVFENITRQESTNDASFQQSTEPADHRKSLALVNMPRFFRRSKSIFRPSEGNITSGDATPDGLAESILGSADTGSFHSRLDSTLSSRRSSMLWSNAHEELAGHGTKKGDSLMKKFFALDEPAPLEACQIRTSVDMQFGSDFTAHIVVFGEVSHLFNFVLPLRRKKLGSIVPIIIVNTRVPTSQEWQELARFEDIYFMQGTPLDMHDLHRVAIRRASRAILFAKVNELSGLSSEALVDADTVFAYSILKKECPDLQVIVELVAQSNISYIADENKLRGCGIKASDRYMYVPPFAAGQIYTSSVLDTLSGQSYYNHKLIDILHQLVVGQNKEDAIVWRRATGRLLQKDIQSSELHMIPMPPNMRGKTYGELVCFLNRSEIIPLGLRRGIQEDRLNTMPYVVTNPPSDMVVSMVDMVFVLSQEPPSQRVSQRDILGSSKFQPLVDDGFRSGSSRKFEQQKSWQSFQSTASIKEEESSPELKDERTDSLQEPNNDPNRTRNARSTILSQDDNEKLNAALQSLQDEVRSELTTLSHEMRAIMHQMMSSTAHAGGV